MIFPDSNTPLHFIPQVWFKNRRAKFRKGQRYSPLCREQSLEEAKPKAEPSNTHCDISPLREPSDASSLSCSSPPPVAQSYSRLHSPPRFPMVAREQDHLPRHQALGILSAGLPINPPLWPILQQHGPAFGLAPPGGKTCSLALQTACSSNGLPSSSRGL